MKESDIRRAWGLLEKRALLWQAQRAVRTAEMQSGGGALTGLTVKLKIGQEELPFPADKARLFLDDERAKVDAELTALGVVQEFRPGTDGP